MNYAALSEIQKDPKQSGSQEPQIDHPQEEEEAKLIQEEAKRNEDVEARKQS